MRRPWLCVFLLAIAFATAANGQSSLATIWSFDGANGDGPSGPLVFDSSGAIYGTTEIGGASSSGTVFKLTPPAQPGGAWTENVLYSFTGGNDGRQPSHGVVFGPDGALYGTTYNGGGTLQACGGGCGVVCRLAPPVQPGGGWTQTVIYAFQGVYDGQNPRTVIFGQNGSLYGVTPAGGPASFSCRRVGCATVFELTPPAKQGGNWTKTVLYSFPGTSTDGRSPNPDIAFDTQGNLYGTTAAGGTPNYYGTVFQLKPPVKANGSWTETVLHDFTGGSDGGYPIGGVVVGANGDVYGTASYSGVANDSGTAFQLTPPTGGSSWTYTVIHTFTGGTDGATPASTPVFDQNGATCALQRGTAVLGRATRAVAPCSSWPRRRKASLGPRQCLPAWRIADKTPMLPWWSLGTVCSTARRFTSAPRILARLSP